MATRKTSKSNFYSESLALVAKENRVGVSYEMHVLDSDSMEAARVHLYRNAKRMGLNIETRKHGGKLFLKLVEPEQIASITPVAAEWLDEVPVEKNHRPRSVTGVQRPATRQNSAGGSAPDEEQFETGYAPTNVPKPEPIIINEEPDDIY